MFDKDLFNSLCEKNSTKLNKADSTREGTNVVKFTDADINRLFSPYQSHPDTNSSDIVEHFSRQE